MKTTTTMDASTVWFSRHSLARLREHHPNIGLRGAREALGRAQYVVHDRMSVILRRPGLRLNDAYYLSADHRGVFVVDVEDKEVVTYLRLDAEQQAIA